MHCCMVSSKILWNSVIRTKNAPFVVANFTNMYLKTLLDLLEYMKMLISLLPTNIIEHYNLHEKAIDGYVYTEIQKGMHGLPQASILAKNYSKNCWHVMGTLRTPHTMTMEAC
jgi:hypothetical protein